MCIKYVLRRSYIIVLLVRFEISMKLMHVISSVQSLSITSQCSYFRVFSSVTQLCLTLRPHGLQHARILCPSPTPGACSDSCPLNHWCCPTISSSVVPFSSRFQSFPASQYFSMSQFFASGSQSIGASASASVFPVNIQDWFSLVSHFKSISSLGHMCSNSHIHR